ncbi:hypothetical protein RB9365 [Rhodopirellula baltica SH 1]|uniref:Uncharacterized protein n=1 Tax=Rhodopirellula baltica (strain DSM 10527 / NCIMB 13988 / SH1) TaxID=243090 RepID=Q7ULP7_RHOBA|nr:hypothetical protein RB9365 [Rhodopirellula baltica SH 1]
MSCSERGIGFQPAIPVKTVREPSGSSPGSSRRTAKRVACCSWLPSRCNDSGRRRSWFKSMRHLSPGEAGGEVERADRGPVRVRGRCTANLASQIARPPHPDLAERLLRPSISLLLSPNFVGGEVTENTRTAEGGGDLKFRTAHTRPNRLLNY